MTTCLLGDIGGTNARFALAHNGVIDCASIMRLRGDDYATFDAALATYLDARAPGKISGCAIAMAGQITDGTGVLTNRDWRLSAVDIARRTGCGRVVLINDLQALGRSVPLLAPGDLLHFGTVGRGAVEPGQALVVNIGTGFNIALVLGGPNSSTSARAEAGHASLPASVAAILSAHLGRPATDFPTIEHVFSGRGLSNLHAAATGQATMEAAQIVEVADETMAIYARMLGHLLHELALMFWPGNGIYLVGSVAGGVMRTPFAAQVMTALRNAQSSAVHLPQMPVALIRSDVAPLKGCLSILRDG